jgi:hypothetical protein
MNLSELVPVIISLAIGIERLLELAWEFVESGNTRLKQRKESNAVEYGSFKMRIITLVGMLIGAGLGGFSHTLGIEIGIESQTLATRIALGFIAGALAPYSHQLIELLYQSQKLVQARKEETIYGTTVKQTVREKTELTPEGTQTNAQTTTEVVPSDQLTPSREFATRLR